MGGEDRIFAKEQALIDLVRSEIEQNRPCVIYIRQTNTRDIQPRIERLIRQYVPLANTFILKNTVEAERREADAVQHSHWAVSLLKRWLIGTHAGAVRDKHLQAYLDEFSFRYNRRKTVGVGRIAARVFEGLVAKPVRTMRQIIDETRRCRLFPLWRAAAAPEVRA